MVGLNIAILLRKMKRIPIFIEKLLDWESIQTAGDESPRNRSR